MTSARRSQPPSLGSVVDQWLAGSLIAGDQVGQVGSVIQRLDTVAELVGATELSVLVSAVSKESWLLATGVDDQGSQDDRLARSDWYSAHASRNVLAAMCCGVDDAAERAGLLSRVPALGRRTQLRRGRPLFDDESLLLRAVVQDMGSGVAPRVHQIACYLAAEAGCMCGEVSCLTTSLVDSERPPRFITASGVGRARQPKNRGFESVPVQPQRPRDSRRLPLDPWQTRWLEAVLATLPARYQGLLAYHPHHNTPGSAAANMSCHRVLDHLLKRAGLSVHGDLTVGSISSYAAFRVYRQGDVEEARRLLGRHTEEQVRADLRLLGAKPAPVGHAKVRRFLPGSE